MTAVIIGAGISGFGAAKFLRKKGRNVRLSERSVLSPEEQAKYALIGAEVRHGGHEPEHLDGATLVVPSPGLPADHVLLTEARRRGLPVVSEIDLALQEYKGTVFGITGTNGKSTTVGMIDHGLRRLGFSTAPAGNFGDPPTLMLAEDRMPANLVLELSSYQLEQSASVHADCAMITSFSNDHLARHGTEKDYFLAKWKLVTARKAGAPVILSPDVAGQARSFGIPVPDSTHIVTETDFPAALKHLEGSHNIRNAAFAALSIHLLRGVTLADAAAAVADYAGLPHRCQLVGTFGGRKIWNDSKSTNVESTLVALGSMISPVVLMMGGIGKGEPYAPILMEKDRIALVLTFGPTGPEIARALAPAVTVKNFPTLASLFQAFGGIMEEYGQHILFSPGCASFDEFRNFAHRGDYFSQTVTNLLTGK
jgi:UDP-N-acetylmuramoylalanine--D-glutamate ligase